MANDVSGEERHGQVPATIPIGGSKGSAAQVGWGLGAESVLVILTNSASTSPLGSFKHTMRFKTSIKNISVLTSEWELCLEF